jgi:hypothetical protein
VLTLELEVDSPHEQPNLTHFCELTHRRNKNNNKTKDKINKTNKTKLGLSASRLLDSARPQGDAISSLTPEQVLTQLQSFIGHNSPLLIKADAHRGQYVRLNHGPPSRKSRNDPMLEAGFTNERIKAAHNNLHTTFDSGADFPCQTLL